MKTNICQSLAISQINPVDSASNAHFEGSERRLASGVALSIWLGRMSAFDSSFAAMLISDYSNAKY
jgi:hypothetical protein